MLFKTCFQLLFEESSHLLFKTTYTPSSPPKKHPVSQDHERWQSMQRQSPERAEALVASHISGKGRRDWAGLTRIVQNWSRRREVSDTSRMKEVSERKFRFKHQQLGYSEAQINSKFAKASSASKFKAGLARRQGKTTFVFMPKARELSSADVMAMQLEGEKEDMYCSSAQAKQMLHGKYDIQLSNQAKKSAFGGICLLILLASVFFILL